MTKRRNGPLCRELRNLLSGSERRAKENLDWLVANMPPIFFEACARSLGP